MRVKYKLKMMRSIARRNWDTVAQNPSQNKRLPGRITTVLAATILKSFSQEYEMIKKSIPNFYNGGDDKISHTSATLITSNFTMK
jgi:hypothetical protein